MRVIAGTARRLQLKTVRGLETRPTTDKIKETLFNMIQQELPGSVFLDLFAGSGAIGIEALSRGAARAVFVEKSPRACACIRENLLHTRLDDRARVLTMEVQRALQALSGGERFTHVFMDPPYGQGLERSALAVLARSGLLAPGALLIVEASRETDFSYLEEMGYRLLRRKEYKTNMHIFIERMEEIPC